MATDSSAQSGGSASSVGGVASGAARLVVDLLVVTCWVVFLTLLFLENAWPRWAFYALLVVGVGVYVTVTAEWQETDESDAPADSSR